MNRQVVDNAKRANACDMHRPFFNNDGIKLESPQVSHGLGCVLAIWITADELLEILSRRCGISEF